MNVNCVLQGVNLGVVVSPGVHVWVNKCYQDYYDEFEFCLVTVPPWHLGRTNEVGAREGVPCPVTAGGREREKKFPPTYHKWWQPVWDVRVGLRTRIQLMRDWEVKAGLRTRI